MKRGVEYVPAVKQRSVSTTVHGTFGELLQGYVRSAQGFEHFLFTTPVVELTSRARLVEQPDAAEASSMVQPSDRTRALAAAELLAAELGRDMRGLVLEVESNIPVAKGHASSTADVLAAADAVLRCFHPDLPAPVSRALALSVARELEYGDYLLHGGIAACLQRSQRLLAVYHTDLRWTVVGVDEGGFVHTEEFHRATPEDPAKAAEYELLYAELDKALRAGDGVRAAGVATASSELHDDRLPKRSLGMLRRVRDATGALGICVAHSGTLAGLIYSRHDTDCDERVADATARLAGAGLAPNVFTIKEASKP